MNKMVQAFHTEFTRYRKISEKAMEQIPEKALNRVLSAEGNSVAMIVRHISGNLTSRFTDFLTSDGEKPWRNRDAEFETRNYPRAEMLEMWRKACDLADQQLSALTDEDLAKNVMVRGNSMTVQDTLSLILAHFTYHAGQIVLLARICAEDEWKWLTVPKKKTVPASAS